MTVELYRVKLSSRSLCVFIVANSEERLSAITGVLKRLGATVGDRNFLEINRSVDNGMIEAALGTLEESERIYLVDPANNTITIGFEQDGRHGIQVGV